jgi:hypothetical protein
VFLTAPESVTPTHNGSSTLLAGDDEGCRNIMFFNQASMYMSSETGFSTLGAASAAGQIGKACFPASAQEAFLMHGISLQ